MCGATYGEQFKEIKLKFSIFMHGVLEKAENLPNISGLCIYWTPFIYKAELASIL